MNALARAIGLPVVTAAALALLGGCGKEKPLYVDGAYVRLNPNPDNPAAGYFTIHGGEQPVTLRAVETDAAVRLEMHESMSGQGGMASMKAIDSVEVPARATVAFAPGGKHLMLWTINPQAIAAGKIQFKLTFSNGDRILVDAQIQGPNGNPTGNAAEAPTAGTTQAHTEVH
ncbi:MAG TPA: copper chaperone PCu(A)C [Sphingobium sp.]|nr:copper chaperone PCu(A)C [Sphingobium sp.]